MTPFATKELFKNSKKKKTTKQIQILKSETYFGLIHHTDLSIKTNIGKRFIQLIIKNFSANA